MTTEQLATSKIRNLSTYEICEMWQESRYKADKDGDYNMVLEWIEEVLEERNEDAFGEWMIELDQDESMTLAPHKFFFN